MGPRVFAGPLHCRVYSSILACTLTRTRHGHTTDQHFAGSVTDESNASHV